VDSFCPNMFKRFICGLDLTYGVQKIRLVDSFWIFFKIT